LKNAFQSVGCFPIVPKLTEMWWERRNNNNFEEKKDNILLLSAIFFWVAEIQLLGGGGHTHAGSLISLGENGNFVASPPLLVNAVGRILHSRIDRV
jgi:hypothetical protein